MPRQWGATRAYVRELDNVPTGSNFTYGGRQYLTNVVPDSAVWNRKMSQIGDGAARFYPTQDWDRFLVPGRVLVVEQPVSGYGFVARTITCFLIEDVEPSTKGEINVRGPGVEVLLTRRPRFEPIGEERVYATAIAPQNQIPVMTTLATGVPSGNQAATLTNATGIEIGEGLRIRRGNSNDGTWHAATVTGKNGNVLNFSPAMSGGQAAAGNDVQGWPASGGEAAHAPVSTTLTVGAPNGMDAATLATTEGINVGDEIRIRTGAGNNGPWFSGRVRSVNPAGAPYPNTVQFVPDLTADAPAGNSVVVRAAELRVYDPRGYAEGQRVELVMNGGGVLETVVAEANGAALTITLRDGLTAAANIGNAVTAYDYGARTTADVTQAMQSLPDWQVSFQTGNGSAIGTAFAPKGESIFDILMSIADRTGEFFRYALDASGIPTKKLEWRRTPDSSGVTLILYDNDEYARQRANELDATKGAAFSMRQKKSFPLITRIYPRAGDQAVTLAACGEEALLYAAVEGCAVHISDDFYEPDYVEYSAGVANPKIGVQAIQATYGDISVDDAANTEQLTAACDQLLLSAVHELLQAQLREYWTVEAYVPVALKPGQTVKIENQTRLEPNVTTAANWIILEVQERQVNGRSRTTLTVSNMLGLRRTGANTLGGILRSTAQSLRRVGGGGSSGTNVSITSGTVGSHGHPEYLPIGGGVTLVGNMPVADNVTVDGVDISAHAANANAHHAAVTLTNLGLLLSGQALGLRLSPSAPGLSIRSGAGLEGLAVLLQSPSGLESTASGLALADAVAGEGLKLTSKALHLDLASPSGLLIATDKLALAVAGNDLSAASVNELRATGHGHRIINTTDGQTNPSTLLASGASGQLRLGGLAVGAAWTGTEGLLVQATTAGQTAARLKAAAAQTAPLWRVENSAGQALVMVMANGDIESGNPGFVSGLTGWQMTAAGRLEANDAFIRGELHSAVFVADEMHATGGTLAVMTATRVAAPVGANDNKLPALAASFVLNLDASYDTVMGYAAAGDVLRIKTMGTPGGGGVDIYDIWLTVDSVGALTGRDLVNGNPGWYPTTVTRRNGGLTAARVPTGSAVVRWGKTGQAAGAFTGGMILTSDLNLAPYLDVFTVPADQLPAVWNNPTDAAVLPKPRVRLGNLDGVLGLPEQWGMAAGVDLSDTSTAARYLVASDQGVELRNIDFRAYNGSNWTAKIQSNGAMSLGSDINAAATTTLEFVASTGALRVGPVGTNLPNLFWSGTALQLRQNITPVITLANDGSSYFAGPMTLGASGGIWQGTGTFNAPTTGLKLYNQGGIGRLATFNGGLIQTAMDTDGAFKAGWDGSIWNVQMNRDGLAMTAGAVATDEGIVTNTVKRLSWRYGGGTVGWVAGRYNSGTAAGGVEVIAGPEVSGAGAKFNYKTGTPQTSSLWATGNLRLWGGDGYAVQVLGDGFEVLSGNAAVAGHVRTSDSLYAANGVIVGGAPLGANANAPGVLTLYRRTAHAANPSASSVGFYVYHNTGTGKYEFIMRNAGGVTVKIAEIAAA